MVDKQKKLKDLDKELKKIKTPQYTKYRQHVFHPDHAHTDYMEYWLENFTRGHSVANVCCGESLFGDIRIDISENSTRTHAGDMFNILTFLKPGCVDFLYIDPPFKHYTTGDNRFKWQFDMFQIPRIALLTRRPKVTVNLPSLRHEYVIFEDPRPSLTLVRIDWKK